MARKLRNVASRGSVNNIILESLLTGQKYGYEIIKEVEEKTNGKVKLKQPSLYSSLKRFETKNIITSYWGDSEIGGRRHYYLLTDYGKKYCEKLLHKNSGSEFDLEDDFEETQLTIDSTQDDTSSDLNEELSSNAYELDERVDEEIELNQKFSSFSVEDKMRELLGKNTEDLSSEQEKPTPPHPRDTFQEDVRQDIINNNPILTDNDNTQEILEQLYDEIENDQLQNPTEEFVEPVVEEIVPDHNFYKPVPLSDYKNERYEESYNILYNKETPVDHKIEANKTNTEEPTPQQIVATRKKKIITDEYGITKLVYEDEENWNRRPPVSAVVTNVDNINIDLVKLANKPERQKRNILDELSDEEREERNIRFLQKFESITNERKTSTTQTNTSIEQTQPIEYKEKLNNLFVEVSDNNMSETPYLEKERELVSTQNVAKKLTDTIDDSTINVKVYSQSKNSKSTSKFVQTNKVKFAFGIIMFLLMLLELTVAMVVLKNKNLLFKDKMWAFKIGYAVSAIMCLFYCIPVFISPNKQTTNIFKLNYAMVFGFLAFFVSLILIYTLNTFGGLTLDNVKYFTPTIVAPLVLASNFIVGPLLYKVLTLNSKFYS